MHRSIPHIQVLVVRYRCLSFALILEERCTDGAKIDHRVGDVISFVWHEAEFI